MSGSPMDPRVINSKACLATFSAQYVDGVDSLFHNKGLEPYFVNKKNSTDKVPAAPMRRLPAGRAARLAPPPQASISAAMLP
jgi:hypothetical protein